MYPFEIFSRFEFGDMVLLYLREGNQLAFTFIPSSMEKKIVEHRKNLDDSIACRALTAKLKNSFKAVRFESMIQLHIAGDSYTNSYGLGDSMLNGGSVKKQQLVKQERIGDEICTIFQDERGVECRHQVKYIQQSSCLEVNMSVYNGSNQAIRLEMLAAFMLNMLSPFHHDDAPEHLRLHRFNSFWSQEGRAEVDYLEELGIEPAWNGGMCRSRRFGQRSSMVVKDYFPVIGLEDCQAKVTWAAQLATCVPWQLQISRIGDYVNLSGGLPDFEFAGWSREVAPGEEFCGSAAVLTCVKGDMQDALSRLTRWVDQTALPAPKPEADLPVLFNEFCSSWGKPDEHQLRSELSALRGSGVKYFVIDAGWYISGDNGWQGIGDWNVAEDKFPGGIDKLFSDIRSAGLIPGIWFEFENCSANSKLFQEHPDWLVKYKNEIFEHCRDRYFLDFRKRAVWDYLEDKLINFIHRHNIGYLKTDYNATLTLADSTSGAGINGTIEILQATQKFYRHLRHRCPELVLEICASGGHRLTGGWLQIGDMGSFSDAHEALSIPLIAANTSMLVPLRRNQIWATLRAGEPMPRTIYSLAAGFMGRLCISGDIDHLSDTQRAIVLNAVKIYQNAVTIIKNGKPRLARHQLGNSYNHPRGYQVFRCATETGELIVIHAFASAPREIKIKIATAAILQDVLKDDTIQLEIHTNKIVLSDVKDFSGVVLRLDKKN